MCVCVCVHVKTIEKINDWRSYLLFWIIHITAPSYSVDN